MSGPPPSRIAYSAVPESHVVVMSDHSRQSAQDESVLLSAAPGALQNDDAAPMLSRPHGQWAHGLCSCCSPPGNCQQCCIASVCAGCQSMKNHSVLERDNPPSCCSLVPCAVFWAFAIIPCGMLFRGFYMRRKVRAFLQIPGDDCDDCCVGLWCGCCAIIQETNTLVKSGHPARLFME